MNPGAHNFHELRPRIVVMGVGGAGGNAVNNMIASGLQGVEFVAANTDAQALSMSGADMRFQMGVNLTEGLGAGSNPEIGEGAAEEVLEEMKGLLTGAHMVFVACGMGGGTGTGAAPVIARVAQEMGVLTVAVVTKPFHFEGRRRMRIADAGIEQLRKYVDTMIVIPNQNLFRLANEQTTFADSFRLADQVLNSGVACVTDLIMKEGLINLDFADVKTVITEMGAAVMGTGMAHGEGRAQKAAEAAIANPLIDDISLAGAKGLLISISGGQDMTLFEVDEVASRIRAEVDPDANIIVGATFDDQLQGHLRVSLVASGLNHAHPQSMHEEADRARMEQDAENERRQLGLNDRLRELEQGGPPQPGGRPGVPQGGLRGPDGGPGHGVNQGRHVGQQPPPPQPSDKNSAQGKGKVQIVNKPPRFITDGLDETRDSAALNYSGEDGPATGREFVPGAPQAIARPMRRMPSMDDLPVTGQNQLRAYEAPPKTHGIEAQKKKVGFFDRLTGRNRDKQEEHQEAPPVRQAGELPANDVAADVHQRSVDQGQAEQRPVDQGPADQHAPYDPAPPHPAAQRPQTPGGVPGAISRHDAAFGKPAAPEMPGARDEIAGQAQQPPQGGEPQPGYESGDGRYHDVGRGNEVGHGNEEVNHSGRSAGFVSGVAPGDGSVHGGQEPYKGQGQPAGERYPTIEINKGAPLDQGFDPDDDEPIADIPPFLRKTTNKR